MAEAAVDQDTLEFGAFAESAYTYDDATKLAWFWQQDVYETKLRMGRKIKWANQKILDQFLYEATGQYNWIVKSPYSMSDAEALADYWGCSVTQAKIVGGHKLGGWIVLNQALAAAPQRVDVMMYVVAAGDNLTKIAKALSNETYKVTADDIFQMNRDVISDPNLIFPGQILRIPLAADWHDYGADSD